MFKITTISVKKRCITSFVAVLAGMISSVFAFEFDVQILKERGFNHIDLSSFHGDNDLFTGDYLASIKINDETILYNQKIHLYVQDGISNVCFTPEIINKLPLKKGFLADIRANILHETDVGKCLGFNSGDGEVSTEFNEEEHSLNLMIPQIYLESLDTNWVSPSQRDYGISGLFIDYSLIGSHSHIKDGNNENTLRSNGVVGVNIGELRFRADYEYASDADNGAKKLDWRQYYGFMDIAALNAKLFVGEIYTRSNVFESTRIKGISLYTDESMMPSYLQGYAPQITGTANSHAIVTIMQYGAVLSRSQVAPGPFAIDDLPSYINGLVDIEIEESGGYIRRYQVDVSHVPFLTRKGVARYNVNLGRLDSFMKSERISENIFSADMSYGLMNNLSAYGGTLFSTNGDYKAINAGLGVNMEQFGAVSLDITQSYNKAKDNTLRGQSYRFNYAKRFGQLTTLNLVGYRFSSRNYTTINNYIQMKSDSFDRLSLEKNRVTLSISQNIPDWNASLSASITKGTYWNKEAISNYNITASKTIQKGLFKDVSWNLSASRNTQYNGKQENQYMLFLTIPLDDGYTKRVQYNAEYRQASHDASQQARYYDKVFGGDISVGVSVAHKRDFSGSIDYGLSASFDKNLAFARVQTNIDHNDKSTRIYAGADGSITFTKHGIATHKKVYENGSRLIVDTGVSGVEIGGEKSNTFGLVGISNVPSYYHMNYVVNNDELPANLNLSDDVLNLAVVDGSIAYRTLGAISGEQVITTISLEDGSHPPFGAIVYRRGDTDKDVAMVADQGLTYLTGVSKSSSFFIKWNSNKSCQLSIPSFEPDKLKNLTCKMD